LNLVTIHLQGNIHTSKLVCDKHSLPLLTLDFRLPEYGGYASVAFFKLTLHNMNYRNITDIKSNPKNPRVIKDDKFSKLVQSIKDFPEMLEKRPLVCFTDTDGKLVVLGGNMRLKAAKECGLKQLPVLLADDWTEEQKAQFLIKDNVGFGEWNWDELQSDWDVKQLEEWGLDLPKEFNIDAEAEEDEFDVPVGGTETDIVLGDIFEIGQHKLICGDSTQTDTFKTLFGEQFADMVITDPPYNVAYEGKTKNKLTIQNDSMGDGDFYQFLYDFYTALGSYTKPGGVWYVWHADSEGANFRKAMQDSGIMVKQCLIWVKNSMVMGRQDYQWKHEPCLYGWKEGAAHGWYSDRKQTTILEFDRPNRNAEHPTMKPIPLFSYQIGNSSKQGDIVADAFGGSGTTMVACHQMNRKAYLVEFDPKYCQVIIDRMKKLDPSIIIKKNGNAI
jgi:site-specific DNA-methyltransferase (adenine-specific)